MSNKPTETPITTSKVFDDPDADIVLQSCDGTQYRVKKVHLQANSSVFEDMLIVGSQSSGSDLDVVPLPGTTAAELDLFLPFLIRGSKHPEVHLDSLMTLFKLGDQYGADTALQFFTLLLRPYIGEHPATSFALGAIYGRYDILVEALEHFGDRMKSTPAKRVWSRSRNSHVMASRGYLDWIGCMTLDAVPKNLRGRIPYGIMWKYLALRERVLIKQEGTWRSLACRVHWEDDTYGIDKLTSDLEFYDRAS